MNIIVLSSAFSRNITLKNELLIHFPGSILNTEGRKYKVEELSQFIEDAEGIIAGLEPMNKETLQKCSRLKIISKYGVGLDNIDFEYCKQRNIHVGWTPGVNKTSVAEMAIAFMIMLCRNLYTSSVQHKSGTWSRNGGMNLRGKTVGIIGMGNIGKEVARLLKPFKCKVLVNDIVDQGEYYKKNKLREASKDEIYQEADFITIHTPLTDLTKYLINKGVLLKMKRSPYLINTARGAIVKQPDLKWALQNNIITGAALDVYDEEPPQDKEFLNLPNLICTPHIGGNSEESVLAMGRSAIKHLIEYFNHNKK